MACFHVLFHKVPFFRPLIALVCGILLAWMCVSLWPVFVLFGFALLFFFLDNFTAKKHEYGRRWMFGLSSFLFFCSIGAVSSLWQGKSDFQFNDGDSFTAVVSSCPIVGDNSVRVLADVCEVDSDLKMKINNNKACAVLFFQKDSASLSVLPGDNIIASPFMISNNERDDAVLSGMKNDDPVFYLSSDSWRFLPSSPSCSLTILASTVQHKLMRFFSDRLSEDCFGVVAALVLGDKSHLDYGLRESYSASGASHVLAVSGMHVGLLYLILNWLLSFPLPGRTHPRFLVRSLLLVLFMWFFAFVTGLSPSVVRASLMFTVVQMGLLLNRHGNIYNSLACSAFFMLLYDSSLLCDVSFLLSFSAIFSIVFFQPVFLDLISFGNRLAQKIWSLVSVSISAQIGTAPFLLFFFHQVSLLFFVSGVVVVPLAMLSMILSLMLLCFCCVPFLGTFVARILEIVVMVMNNMVDLFASSAYSDLSYVHFGCFSLVCSLACVVSLMVFVVRRRPVPLLCTLFFAFSLFASESVSYFHASRSKVFAVCDVKGVSVVNLCSTSENVVYSAKNVDRVVNSLVSFHSDCFCPPPVVDSTSVYRAGGVPVFYILRSSPDPSAFSQPLCVKYLVVSENVKVKPADLKYMFDFEKLIIDSSNSQRCCDWWIDQLDGESMSCHIVPLQGSFVDRF